MSIVVVPGALGSYHSLRKRYSLTKLGKMLVLSLTLLLFLIILATISPASPTTNNDGTTMQEVIMKLLESNQLLSCSIVQIDINSSPNFEHDNFLSPLALDRDSFLVQIDPTESTLPPNPLPSPYWEESLPSTSLESITDVHQYRAPCTIALITFSPSITFTLSLANKMYQSIIKWSNVVKKDEDYYIFVLPKMTQTEDNLLLTTLGTGIKFKILLQQESAQFSPVSMTTICFFCASGAPTIIPLNPSSPHFFPDTSTNLHTKDLRVGTPTGTRWINELLPITSPTTGKKSYIAKRGLYKIVMDNLMHRYNFTCTFFPSLFNGGTGYRFKNGTWVGTVGNVLEKSADIGHVTGQTASRSAMVGFTYPVSYEMLTFTTGQPLPYFSWKAILWPLSSSMWIGVGASLILANIILLIIVSLTRTTFDLTHILSYTIASLVEQDVPSAERISAAPFRSFVCFWLFFTLVISTAYKSKLVSLLSFPNAEEPPKTFEELATSTDYKYALQYLRGAAYSLLQTSPNPTYKTIFSRMELEEDDVACFERVIGKRFVCISWAGIADFIFKRNLTDQYGRVPVVKAPVYTCFLSVGMAMEKRAVMLANFNKIIIRSTDSGLLARWWDDDMNFVYKERRDWERATNKSVTRVVQDGVSDALTNKHFRGSYYLLALGTVCGMIRFVWELIFDRMKKGRDNTYPLLN